MIPRSQLAILATALLMGVALRAHAAATLTGVVRQNSADGALAVGVQISSEGANPALTDSNGRFRLIFPKRQAGEDVRIRVVREGWEVVNSLQLEEQRLPRQPVESVLILISKPAERERWALAYYQLRGREAIEASYQQKLRALTLDNAANIRERERLRNERDRALEQTADLARLLASATADESEESYKRATKLFLDGKIDEALAELNDEHLQRSARKATARIEGVALAFQLRGKLLVLQLRFGEAEDAYRKATRLATQSFKVQLGSAHFYDHLRKYADAQPCFERALELAREEKNAFQISATLQSYASLLERKNEFRRADAAFEEALVLRRELAKSDPEHHLELVAETLGSLAGLYRKEQRYEKAQAAYEESLSTFRDLARKDPQKYKPEIAAAFAGIGNLFSSQQRWEPARETLEMSVVLYQELAEASPTVHKPNLALALNNLGLFYNGRELRPLAHDAFKESLRLRRELVRDDRMAYLPDLALTLMSLGVLFSDENDLVQADTHLREAMQIYRELVPVNPTVYAPDMAAALYAVGVLNAKQSRFPEARAAFTESLAIFQEALPRSPGRFQPMVDLLKELLQQLPK